MRIRSILYLVTFIASCVGLWFLVDRFSGFNERSQSEEEVGDGDLAQQVAVRRSRNLDQLKGPSNLRGHPFTGCILLATVVELLR